MRRDFADARQIIARELDFKRAEIFLEIGAALRSRNRHDVFTLCEHPGEGQLRRLAALFLGDFANAIDHAHVLLKIVALEPREVAAIIVRSEVLEAANFAREKAASERAIGDEADAQLAARREDFILGLARPERVFRLQRSDRMNA